MSKKKWHREEIFSYTGHLFFASPLITNSCSLYPCHCDAEGKNVVFSKILSDVIKDILLFWSQEIPSIVFFIDTTCEEKFTSLSLPFFTTTRCKQIQGYQKHNFYKSNIYFFKCTNISNYIQSHTTDNAVKNAFKCFNVFCCIFYFNIVSSFDYY